MQPSLSHCSLFNAAQLVWGFGLLQPFYQGCFCIAPWDSLSGLCALWDSLSSFPSLWLGRCTLGWPVWPVVGYPLLGVHASISIVKLIVIGYHCNHLDGQLNCWASAHWLIGITTLYWLCNWWLGHSTVVSVTDTKSMNVYKQSWQKEDCPCCNCLQHTHPLFFQMSCLPSRAINCPSSTISTRSSVTSVRSSTTSTCTGTTRPIPRNWSYFKPEFSGKSEEDAEAHLLRTNNWMETNNFPGVTKVPKFCLTLTGEARLWYESLKPIVVDWQGLQDKFRQQYLKFGNTQEQLFHIWRLFHYDENV